MPRRRIRIPRAKRPRPPVAAAMSFQKALRGRWDRAAELVRRRIIDEWGQNARAHGPRHPSYRGDATASGWVEERLRELAAHLKADSPAEAVTLAASRVVKKNGADFKRLVPISLRKSPDVAPLLQGFRDVSLAKIRTLDDAAIDDLRDVLDEAEREGWRVDELSNHIEDRLGVSSSKAETLARTTTLQFNAQVSQARQASAGITQFVWSTSGDERVRESHDELDGQTFSWDDLPTVDDEEDVAPGMPFNCRCVAVPILPDLESQAGEAEEDDAVSAFAEEPEPLAAEE